MQMQVNFNKNLCTIEDELEKLVYLGLNNKETSIWNHCLWKICVSMDNYKTSFKIIEFKTRALSKHLYFTTSK